MRLADVIGPYDETYRLWKYVTWMKALLGQSTRLSEEQTVQMRGSKIKYEVPRDVEHKLSFTYSYDVANFITNYIGGGKTNETG